MSIYAICAVSLVFLLLLRQRYLRKGKLPLPPGPKKLPLVGNLFDMPSSFQWETYANWSRLYDSDIIHLNIAGASIIVLSSPESVTELLEKRSNMYSDRARLPMAVELMGWGFNFAFSNYGEHWRQLRRMYHQEMNPTTVQKYLPQAKAATHKLLFHLMQNSNCNVVQQLRHMTGEFIISTAYGIAVLPEDDPYVNLAEEAVGTLLYAITPGLFLVDSIPFLMHVPEWLPGAGFKRTAREWRKLSQAMIESPFTEAKRLIAEGSATPNFTSTFLADIQDSEADFVEKDVKEGAGTMYIGGTGTMASVLGSFVLAMLANPAAQMKAQMEIDSVLGTERLPDFADETVLPYISAIVREVFRWKPILPLGVPHFINIEDEYRGYRIPAHSTVMANVWAIFHDKSIYPAPEKFKPERWLLDNGQLNPAMSPDAIYGFGRRHLANMSVWLTIASILATLDISKALDEEGSPIEPSYEYISTLTLEPVEFKCSIKPRTKAAERLIEEAIQTTIQ